MIYTVVSERISVIIGTGVAQFDGKFASSILIIAVLRWRLGVINEPRRPSDISGHF